jgi:hypothetical protein
MSAKAQRKSRMPGAAATSGAKGNEICLRLYVASTTPNSERAKANLDTALRDFADLPRFSVEFVDVLADAKRAVTDNVIVTPTLLAIGPKRQLIMIGDLSDSNKLQGLLKAAASFS